jgi:hypothetical protein
MAEEEGQGKKSPEAGHGSWFGDAMAEYHKLPTGGKIAVIGVGLLVIVIAIYEYRKHSTSTSASQIAGTPSGLNGLSGGNSSSGQGQNPAPGGGSGPFARAGVDYGLIPFGGYNGPSYSNLKPGTHFNWLGIDYILGVGTQGKLFGYTPTGQQVLLYEPASFYPGGQNYHGLPPPPSGSGGGGYTNIGSGGGGFTQEATPSPRLNLGGNGTRGQRYIIADNGAMLIQNFRAKGA